jgi:hypothetical protein
MTQYEFAIAGLLAAQAFTLTLLWLTKEERDWFRMAWIRDSMDLLDLKRERN